MNIIEFIEDPALIGDRNLSPAQKMSLKAVYGLSLTPEELELYRLTTGLQEYQPREWTEATFILGRRAGKSDKLASNIALFEACARNHKLSVGESGIVMLVSPELLRTSRICFQYIEGKLERSKILRQMIRRKTADTIELRNGISIQTFPCNLARIRGQSLVCFIGDEAAFWKVEGRSVDKEVLDAARPGLSFPTSKMIKISSPWMTRGEVFEDFKRNWGKSDADIIVFKGSTQLFFPGYSKHKLEAARRRDPVAFAQEHLAEFRSDLSGMYDSAVIDAAVNPDRPLELPYRQRNGPYAAFVDCAGGGGRDSYALAIGHREGERIIVDLVRSRPPRFNPEATTAEYADLLQSAYSIREVRGDKFSGDWASNAFAKFGIDYQRAEKPKSQLYLEAEGPLNTQRVELPNREPLITQLKSLVRKTRSGGRDSVDTDSGQSEDEANVVAGLIDLLAPYDVGQMSFGVVEHDVYPRDDGSGGDSILTGSMFRSFVKGLQKRRTE